MDKGKKKRIKRYLTWTAMALAVVYLAAMPLLAKKEAQADGPQASILSAAVETGSVVPQLRGGGTLESLDSQDVNIPAGVKITGFLVKNGDHVEAGTPLATVDKVSVMEAILSVQDTMEFLREEMEANQEETVDSTIKAVAGGRVKILYAQTGEALQDVMLDHGALAVLSIDGLMAVKFQVSSDLATGQILDVTLEDGSKAEGRVASNLDGTVIITVEDEGYAVDQAVTVEGLGTGRLIIHNPWKATGFTGTVARVHVKQEQTLSDGATLFTLSDRDFTGQLQHRASQHQEYEVLLQRLMVMYESGTIDAPCGGIVTGVDEKSTHLLAAGEESWEVTLLDNAEPSYEIVLLSGSLVPDCDYSAVCQANTHKTDQPHACISNPDPAKACPAAAGTHTRNCISSCVTAPQEGLCTAAVHKADCIENCSGDRLCTPNKSPIHKTSCITHCQNSSAECSAQTHYPDCIGNCTEQNNCTATHHHPGCIKSCNGQDNCPANTHQTACVHFGITHYTGYAAIVEQVAPLESKLIIRKDDQTLYDVEKKGSQWVIKNGTLDTNSLVTPDIRSVVDTTRFQEKDIILILTGHRNGQTPWEDVVVYPVSSPGDGSGSKFPGFGGGFGGLGGFGSYSGYVTQDTEDLHDLEGATLLTVTPRNRMKLTITLDEQDIAKVSVGMTAQVKVEALKNQVFPATVTKIGTVGINSGGSSKFSVELELEAGGDMLSGMSASASIVLSAREAVLKIPVAAVYEKDGRTLVYTALDKDSGEPASPKEVELGLSDGEFAEVLSGLTQEDRIYYHYYDTLQEDTSAEADRFSFG